jgi:hypothetical protein
MGLAPKRKTGLDTGTLDTNPVETKGGLRTAGETATGKLMRQAGVDLLEPGGFRRRDEINKNLNEAEHSDKRMSRAFNLAYRDAV